MWGLPSVRTVRVFGVSLVGIEADLVSVEARFEPVQRMRTQLQLSGLPDAVIRESRSRLMAALEENQLHIPNGKLVLNLAPAGLKKGGEGLDLPLALGAAAACGHMSPRMLSGTLFLGELSIDGRVHPVPGGFAAAEAAKRAGIKRIVCAPATAAEAVCLPDIEVLAGNDLRQIVHWVVNKQGLERVRAPRGDEGDPQGKQASVRTSRALAEVRGQAAGKHALAVAATGGHALFFMGPPGIGKSLLARALIELLAPPRLEERLDITRVLSALGRWPGGLASERPYRAPHHTTSHAGLIGGGSPPHAGEITLAHCGVLFLDELPEFRREVLEALRQPLETGSVLIARASRTVEFPANFHLVCAANPCPCGYRGHPKLTCKCSPNEVWRYRRRISGPLLDRMDLRVELAPPGIEELAQSTSEKPSTPTNKTIEGRICEARSRMRRRQDGLCNAQLDTDGLDAHAPLHPASRAFFAKVAETRALSARGVQSLRRVARTLADLQGRKEVHEIHLAEALALRAPLFDQ